MCISKEYLNREACEKLLNNYNTPEWVKKHCREVCRVSVAIAVELNKHEYNLKLEIIERAALLHDIARVLDKHWEIGADMILKMGYPQEAEIIREHMFYDFPSGVTGLKEIDLVCMGDRLVLEDKYTGIEKRMDYVLQKCGENEHAKTQVRKKFAKVQALLDDIEIITGKNADEICG